MAHAREQRHQWKRDGEWAVCTRCGLKVESKRVKRGGLPKCAGVLESKPSPPPKAKGPTQYFRDYLNSYRKGCERFGIWWKIFTASMIVFAITFFTVAIGLILIYLI